MKMTISHGRFQVNKLLPLLDLVKNKWAQLLIVAILFFVIGHCTRDPKPQSATEIKVEQKSEEKNHKVTDVEVVVTKPDGTKIQTKAKITEDIFKTDYLKSETKEVIAPAVSRVFFGVSVSTYIDKREYEFGVSAAYRFDHAIVSATAFPAQQRAEASILIPTDSIKLPGWLK